MNNFKVNIPDNNNIIKRLNDVTMEGLTSTQMAHKMLDATADNVFRRVGKITKDKLTRTVESTSNSIMEGIGVILATSSMMQRSDILHTEGYIREINVAALRVITELCCLSETVKSFTDGKEADMYNDEAFTYFAMPTAFALAGAYDAKDCAHVSVSDLLPSVYDGALFILDIVSSMLSTLYKALENEEFEDNMEQTCIRDITDALSAALDILTSTQRMLVAKGILNLSENVLDKTQSQTITSVLTNLFSL